MIFKEQAESCRKQASEYAGRPEAPFLLRVATAFDQLALETDVDLIAPTPYRHQPTRVPIL